jgi:hypothetical protein
MEPPEEEVVVVRFLRKRIQYLPDRSLTILLVQVAREERLLERQGSAVRIRGFHLRGCSSLKGVYKELVLRQMHLVQLALEEQQLHQLVMLSDQEEMALPE